MWTECTIGGHRVDMLTPISPPVGICIYLHDRDERTLRAFAETVASAEAARLALASPHGGECWWTDRIWPPFDEQVSAERWLLQLLVPDLQERWRALPLSLTGMGMGGSGALRIAFKNPEIFPIVAAIDAAVDCHDLYYEGTPLDDIYSSPEHCRQDSPVLQVNPVRQPAHIYFACASSSRWERGNDRLDEKLAALGVEHLFKSSDATAPPTDMLAFVRQAIIAERRKLI